MLCDSGEPQPLDTLETLQRSLIRGYGNLKAGCFREALDPAQQWGLGWLTLKGVPALDSPLICGYPGQAPPL